jgi:type I restriction enzyme M protein
MTLDNSNISWITNFIWNIADDVLRDLYVRGKYRDVILPMTVIRRLDAVLEPTKAAVIKMKENLDMKKIANQDAALRQAAKQAFYNTSPFTLRDLKNRSNQQQLKADFEEYLDGFSPNVQTILTNFEFRNQIPRLTKADVLGTLIEKFLDPQLNLSPTSTEKAPALDNHAMGTIFEELVRKFNEENNEEAGEHWTPRDAVQLMARLMFEPVAEKIQSGTYLLYDCACGTGGMLTVADETLQQISRAHKKQVATHLYGQEINAETYAICKADMLIKGEGENADNIVGGPEFSTLSNDAFQSKTFDFMLANPPYGKSWKGDLERMGGKKNIKDPRFVVSHNGDSEFSLLTSTSDGQLLFLANMISKMKHDTELGSRIVEVHNGSSLFTGDAGQGASNIRQWIIENDWLEAIVALPLNFFYNTSIATFVWVISNRKSKERKGKVQLIDATTWFKQLRKNLGKKNCELSGDDIDRILATYKNMTQDENSKIFENQAFGYWKIVIEHPLRLKAQLTISSIENLRFISGDTELRKVLHMEFGDSLFVNFKSISKKVESFLASINSDEEEESDKDSEDTDVNEGAQESKKKISEKVIKKILDEKTWTRDGKLYEAAMYLRKNLGDKIFEDFNHFRDLAEKTLANYTTGISASEVKTILKSVSFKSDDAPPVIAKIQKKDKLKASPLYGAYEAKIQGELVQVEYEIDPDLREIERVPLLYDGGIEGFFKKEILPHHPDSWIKKGKNKIGYEISFNRYFHKPSKMRTLKDITEDIIATEQKTESMLKKLLERNYES